MQQYAMIGNLYLNGVEGFKLKDGDGVIECSKNDHGAMPYADAVELWNDMCDERYELERDEEHMSNK